LVGLDGEQEEVAEQMPVYKSVAADVNIQIDPFGKPKLHIAFRKVHRLVINTHMLGHQPDLRDSFQQVEINVFNLEAVLGNPRTTL